MIMRLINFFIKDYDSIEPTKLIQTKVTAGLILIFVFLTFTYSMIYYFMGFSIGMFLILGVIPFLILCLAIIKYTGKSRLAAYIFIIGMTSVQVSLSTLSGGLYSPNIAWWVTTSFMSVLTLGMLTGLLMALANVIIMITMHFLLLNGIIHQIFSLEKNKDLFSLIMYCGLLVASAGLASIFEQLRNSARNEMNLTHQNLQENLNLLGNTKSEIFKQVEELNGFSIKLNEAATKVNHGNSEIAQESLGILSATQLLDNKLQMIAASLEEMSVNSGQIANNASTAATLSNEGKIEADKNKEQFAKLQQSATLIDSIVDTVTQIANQTNLLALNASIEAVNAVEAGKGFSVVAAEVKELAKQTMDASEEIKQRISDVQQITNVTNESNTALHDTVNKINQLNSAIALSIEEQNIVLEESSTSIVDSVAHSTDVAKSIKNISKKSQESVENSIKNQNLSDQLNDLSQKLSTLSESLKI